MATDHNFKVKNGLAVEGADLKITGDGNDTRIESGGEIRFRPEGSSSNKVRITLNELEVSGSIDASANLKTNNTTRINSSGGFTLGSGSMTGPVTISPPSGQNTVLNLNGALDTFLEKDTGNHFYIANNVADKDIKFRINDGGTQKIPLTIHGQSGTVDLTGDLDVSGDLAVSGDLNITGDINSVNTTDLDITDKTITLSKGSTSSSNSDGAGIIIEGPSPAPELIYQHSNSRWTLNKEVFGSQGFMIGTTSTDVGLIRNNAGVFDLQAQSGREISFSNATNGEHVRIDADGKVGIGTNNPGVNLQINDSTTTQTNSEFRIYGYDTGTSDAKYGRIFIDSGGNLNVAAQDSYLILTSGNYIQANDTLYALESILMRNNKKIQMAGSDGGFNGVMNVSTSDVVQVGGVSGWGGTIGQLALYSNDGEAVRIDENQWVGIGTNDPSRKLHVYQNNGTNVVAAFESNDAQVWIDLRDSNSTSYGGSAYGCLLGHDPVNDNLFIVADGNVTKHFVVDNTGNVGIGTSDPKTDLHVLGASGNAQATTVRLGGDGANGNHTPKLEFTEGTTGTSMNFGFSLLADGNSSNNFLIRNHNSSTGGAVAICVDRATGFVGIGNNSGSPKSRLDINSSGDNFVYLNYTRSTGGTNEKYWRSGIETNHRFAIGKVNDAYNSLSEYLTILSGGNVGIGINNPSEKLEVNGNIKADTLKIDNIVFEDEDGSPTDSITASTEWDGTNSTLSFEGSAGQLFAISNNLTGTIFSVNDISGIPSIEVEDDGEIRFAEFGGYVKIGHDSSVPGQEAPLIVTKTQGTLPPAPDTPSKNVAVFQNNSTAGEYSIISIIGGNTGRSAIHLGDTDDDNAGAIYYTHADNKLHFRTNSSGDDVQIEGDGTLNISTGDLRLGVGKKFYMGGSNHTYISEDIDDRLRFFTGGQEFMRFTEAGTDTVNFYTPVSSSGTITAPALNGTDSTNNVGFNLATDSGNGGRAFLILDSDSTDGVGVGSDYTYIGSDYASFRGWVSAGQSGSAGGVRVSDGSGAAPTLSFADRTDTGLWAQDYGSGEDRVMISTGGSIRAEVQSAGVYSYANVYAVNEFRNITNTWKATTSQVSQDFQFIGNTSNTPVTIMHLDTGNANVGIGTTSTDSTYKLQIAGAQRTTVTGSNTVAGWFENTDDHDYNIRIVPKLSSGGYNPITSTGDSGIIFSTDNDHTNAVDNNGLIIAPHSDEKGGLYIAESGNVGINVRNTGSQALWVEIPTAQQSDTNLVAYFKSHNNKACIQITDNDTTAVVSAEGTRMSLGGQQGVHANNVNINTSNANTGIGVITGSDGDLSLNVPRLHVKGVDTAGAFNLVARFQGGNDADNTGGAILVNHSNDRGLLIEGGRSNSDRAIAHLGLVNSAGAHNRVLTIRQDGSNRWVGIGIEVPEALLHVKADNGTTATIRIEGGNSVVSANGEINSQLDFGSNDGSVNSAGQVAGRIASVTENPNGAFTGMAFYTFTQSGSPDLAEKMRIRYDGSVGIGEASPTTAKLVVNGNTNQYTLRLNGGTSSGTSYGARIRAGTNTSDYGLIVENTSAGPQFAVRGDGHVGIGTNDPIDQFHLKSSSGDARMVLESPVDSDCEIKLSESGTVKFTVGFNAADDTFRIGTTNVDTNPRMAITSAGKVGFGRENPHNKFHVIGDGRFEGNLMTGSASYTNVPAKAIHIKDSGDNACLRIEDSTGSNKVYDFRVNTGAGLKIIDQGTVGTGNNVRFRIEDDGKVGIGNFPTTNNNSNNHDSIAPGARLHVYETGGGGTEKPLMILENYISDHGTTPSKVSIELRNQDSNNNPNRVSLKNVTVNSTTYGVNDEAAAHFVVGLSKGGSIIERAMFHADGHMSIGAVMFNPYTHVNTGSYFKPKTNITNNRTLSIGGGDAGADISLASSTTTDGGHVGGLFFTSTAGATDAHKQLAGIDCVYDLHGTNSAVSGGDLRFFTKPTGSGINTPRMWIRQDGNIYMRTAAGADSVAWDAQNSRFNCDWFGGYQFPANSFLDFDNDSAGSGGSNGVHLASVAGMDFTIDTNNNGTVDEFTWRVNSPTASTATELMSLDSDGDLTVTGALAATTKSFDIVHPTKEGKRLHHGVLEGPEHAVYIRGKTKESIIQLPEYWNGLVHEDTITVQLTSIGRSEYLYVDGIRDNTVSISNDTEYFYFIQAERKDVERFEVEYDDVD